MPLTGGVPRWLTITEVGEALRMSRWTVTRLIQRGELTATKSGNTRSAAVRISKKSFDAFLERNTIRPEQRTES